MKKNMSNMDRYVRLIVVAIIAGFYYTGVIGGTVAIILGVIGIIFLLTSLVNFCPLYSAFGLSTKGK